MIDILKYFKSLIKLESIHTDNNVFKLHYKVTVIMLLAFSTLLTSKQYFGDPIKCDVNENQDIFNTFCWVYGTFVVKSTLADKQLPGLGLDTSDDPSTIHRQLYYQWVCIVFCIQAVIFYIPRYLWKTWEAERLRLLLSDFTGPIPSPSWTSEAKDKLVQHLLSGKSSHNIYVIRYCFCEVLNFVNVIAQIYFLDWFIMGQFSWYGIAYASHQVVNPMNSVFPKVTKCSYNKYGPSGTLSYYDALCILPLNILNEKLFLILWYWLFILLLVSFCALIYRALFLFMPKFRVYLLRAQTRNIEGKKAQAIVDHISYGDFFVLYRIGKNINPILYKELVWAIHDYTVGKNKDFKLYPRCGEEV